MKDFLTDEDIDSFVTRLNRLDAAATPQWGKLSVNGMLHHCNLLTSLIINSVSTRKPKLKERFMKPVFYMLKKLPKNVKSGSQYLAEKPDALLFAAERNAFLETLTLLKNHTLKLMGVHSVFGPLNTNEWRKFLLLHTDHHLRQFSV